MDEQRIYVKRELLTTIHSMLGCWLAGMDAAKEAPYLADAPDFTPPDETEKELVSDVRSSKELLDLMLELRGVIEYQGNVVKSVRVPVERRFLMALASEFAIITARMVRRIRDDPQNASTVEYATRLITEIVQAAFPADPTAGK